MKNRSYQYVLDLFKEDASHLGHLTVEADLEPIQEWSLFWGIRQGRLPPVMNRAPSSVEPVWHPKVGEPYLAGLRCVFWAEGDIEVLSTTTPITYFWELAQQASSHFVKEGLLKPGDRFYYSVCAFPCEFDVSGEARSSENFSISETETAIPLGTMCLKEMKRQSVLFGASHEADMPLFMPKSILDETLDLADWGGAKEIGGIFVGKLYRDTDSPEVIAVVSAQVLAEHIQSHLHRVTFTAETWTAVKAAIELRGNDELMLAWWHTHNFMRETCKECKITDEKRKCPSPIFMSADDVLFHRTMFPRAWSTALVIGESPCAGLDYALYGWRYGVVQPRGFYVLDGQVPDTQTQAGSLIGGDKKNGT